MRRCRKRPAARPGISNPGRLRLVCDRLSISGHDGGDDDVQQRLADLVLDVQLPMTVAGETGMIGEILAQIADGGVAGFIQTLGTGRDALFARLQAERWIFKRAGNKNWLAYDDKRRSGYLEHDDHLYTDNEGRERVATRVLVTAKGLVKLAEVLNRPLH